VVSTHRAEASGISRAGLVQLALSILLMSSAWPAAKYALKLGTTPLWFAEGRAALSFLTVTLIVMLRGQLRGPRRADLPALFSIGALQLGAFFAFAHAAVAWVPAGRTGILANTTTIFVVPLSLLILRERIPALRWLAAGLGLAGVMIMMGPWAIDWTDRNVLIGHGFLLGAGLSWSIAIIVVRGSHPAPGSHPRLTMLELLPWCFLLASLLILALMLWFAPDGTLGPQPSAWAALAYIGLLAGPLGTWCILEATAMLPTVVSSVGFLATPAVGLILSNILLGEPFTADLLAGSALILGGVGCAAWPGRRPRPGRHQ
jgi:drug/metabolite transporter (DMT)-like permease